MDMEKVDVHNLKVTKRSWRRAIVATSVLGGMVLSGMSVLPWAVMSTSYRDSILNARFEKMGLKATSASGAGGWLDAFAFNDVKLADETGQITCTIKSIQVSKSLLSILVGGGDLGLITVIQPALRVALDDDGKLPPRLRKTEVAKGANDTRRKWDVAFDVQNAAFVLSVPWRPIPIVDVDNVDVSGAVASDGTGRWLTVDPIEIFDQEPLSELHTEQNLALIAPVLSQSTSLSGEVSVRLEGIRMRLDAENATPYPIRGQAALHSVQADLKKEWAIQLGQLIGQATGRSGGNRLTIAEDSTVNFEVNEKGIYHHGLAFLLPDLAGNLQVSSSGLVGLDETVDLTLGIQFPQLLPGNAFMAALSKMVRNPLQLKVEGTISEPKLVNPPGMSIVDQLSGNLTPMTQGAPPPSVPGAVMELIGSAASPNPSQSADGITGGVLNIIRAAQEAKKNAPPKEPRVKKGRGNKGL